MTMMETPQPDTGQTYEQGGLVAPWWHTALMVIMIISLSVAGVKQLRSFGSQPLHLTTNYILTIVYEWVLAALVLWGLHMRKVPLRQLSGRVAAGSPRVVCTDLGVALGYWAGALLSLAVLGNILVKMSGSHIDPQKIGDVTQKLAPVTGLEMVLFLVLSISAGICEVIGFSRLPAAAICPHDAPRVGRGRTLCAGVWRRARLRGNRGNSADRRVWRYVWRARAVAERIAHRNDRTCLA